MEEKALQEARDCAAETVRLINEILEKRKIEWHSLWQARVKAAHAENVLLNLDLRLRGHKMQDIEG